MILAGIRDLLTDFIRFIRQTTGKREWIAAGLVLIPVAGSELTGPTISHLLRPLEGWVKTGIWFGLLAGPFFLIYSLAGYRLPARKWSLFLLFAFFCLAGTASLEPVKAYLTVFPVSDPGHLLQLKLLISSSLLAGYLVPLAFFAVVFRKKRLDETGFRFSFPDWKVVSLLFLLMVPLVVSSVFSPGFTAFYPTWLAGDTGEIPLHRILAHESLYGLNFVATEWFFRGLLVIIFLDSGAGKSILPVTVLYTLWHLGKPPAELITSFGGGLFLGYLAVRTGSISGGVVLHLGVAFLLEAVAFFLRSQAV